jgi:anti-sigma factor ChrR (cupin superfamily)
MTVPARPSARCRKLLRELSRYLDGELTPARRRTVEQHVAACKCCGNMAARLRKTIAACRVEGGRRPPSDVIARAADRIRALITQGALGPRKVTGHRITRNTTGDTR